MNRWIALGLLVGTAVAAQERPLIPTDCDDKYAECKEDCLIRWGGGTDLKKRAKNNQCINACSKVELDCRETFFETKRNNLDEGSIAGNPNSRDVDSDGMPTKTAKKGEPKPKKVEEDLRDEPKKEERAPEPKRELAAEETPKSTRTQLKADPKEKPAEKPAAEKPAEKAPEQKRDEPPPPRREEPKPAPVEEAAPPPPKKEKKEEKREEPKEKKRSLDEWDPDAL